MKKAFSLTYVEYEEDDMVGLFLALLTLAPIFIMVMYATLIIWRRDLWTIFLTVGQLINEGINYGAKLYFQEHRPEGSDKTDFGMPSNHAQFIAFFGASALFFLHLRYRTSRKLEVALGDIFIICLTFGVIFSRVYLGYHDPVQVEIGADLGAMIALLWYLIMANVFQKAFPYIENWRISKALLIKDYTLVDDAINFEYTNVMNSRKPVAKKI